MLDPLESTIAEAMNNGNDIQPFEVAEAIRRSPNVSVSIVGEDKTSELTEMTRFGVHLQVDVETKELSEVGSPIDWEWGKMVDRYMGGDALTNVNVRSVSIESTAFIDSAGKIVMETTYSVHDRSPNELEGSFETILSIAQDSICDNHYNHGTSKEMFQEDMTSLARVRDIGRNHFHNPNLGDRGIDDAITHSKEI